MDRAAATNESQNTRCGSMSDIRHHVKTGHSKSRAEDLAFEILEIADDSSRDYVKKTGVDRPPTAQDQGAQMDAGPDGAQKVRQPLSEREAATVASSAAS
jgi:hypothetical protein